MALSKFAVATNNISSLSDEPNVIDGLTGPELQLRYDKGSTDLKTFVNDTLTVEIDTSITNINAGYISMSAVLTYSSADSPTFVASTSVDCTGFLSVGMKIRLVQGGVTKYFFITAITSTTITLYGGTDYTLTNTAISDVYFSVHKAPYGFPINPDKWSYFIRYTPSLSTPSNNAWWNPDGISMTVPIGCWNISYDACGRAQISASSSWAFDMYSTLSTSNNSESDARFTSVSGQDGPTSGSWTLSENIHSDINILLTSKTPYYILHKISTASTIGATNGFRTVVLKYICAYL